MKKTLNIEETELFIKRLNTWAKMTKKEKDTAISRAMNTTKNGKQLGIDVAVLNACIDLKILK